MKRRFILYRRKLGSMFYIEDTETRKRESDAKSVHLIGDFKLESEFVAAAAQAGRVAICQKADFSRFCPLEKSLE